MKTLLTIAALAMLVSAPASAGILCDTALRSKLTTITCKVTTIRVAPKRTTAADWTAPRTAAAPQRTTASDWIAQRQ